MYVEWPQSSWAETTCNVNGIIQYANVGSEWNLFDNQITWQTRQDRAANSFLGVGGCEEWQWHEGSKGFLRKHMIQVNKNEAVLKKEDKTFDKLLE